MVTLDDALAAARRIDGHAHRTPILTSRTLDELTGAEVHLKCENLQRGGAFKFRGAFNTIASLSDEERARGVFTWSSGNHAQAVALSAREHGIPATILMPHDAPQAKVDATRGYGAEIVQYDRYEQDRYELGTQMAAERGATVVPPYDHPMVMAGTGTIALEVLDDLGEIDTFVTPLSGGGLLAGTSTVVKARSPGTRVIGIEPEAGNDWQRSLAAGERIRIDVPRTIADGLQVDIPGEFTWDPVRSNVDEVQTVSDEEIVAAMRLLFERCKLVVEPSGAVGVAALLSGRIPNPGRVAVVLSGGNVGAEQFARLVSQ